MQQWLESNYPEQSRLAGTIAPDGDADIDHLDYGSMQVPDCEYCGGIIKPNAVFFGDSIPKDRVAEAQLQLQNAEGLLVVGSSLAVYSGYRFCLWAQQQGKPILIVNQGKTRADEIASLRVGGSCARVLQSWLDSYSG
jgi:NAD-dependent SIR2 family protein deacetylase